ncbi:MAG TPA: DUF3857 domain-containing protein [Steroidobacteraceae bacterium]|nr:DUF3857 domain-containing protein [Steroidobacteraceae bacterium]
MAPGAALAALMLFFAAPALASDAPDWLRAQLAAPIPAHDDEAPAVLLYSETVATFTANGKLRRLDRRAYRILRPEGERYGLVHQPVTAWSRVLDMRGWSIPSDGKPYEVKDRDAVEAAVNVTGGDLVSDVRIRVLKIPAATPGSVVGYEVTTEEQPPMSTDTWEFQDEVPGREARYMLELPPGWQYQAVWLNHPEVAPISSGQGRWAWTVSDLRALRNEPHMPPRGALVGQMQVLAIPPGGRPAGIQSWHDIGTWYNGLTAGRRDPSPEIRHKVAELTAALPEPVARIRAIAAFVQTDVRYVAIELGIGGYQPHPATEVFVHRYGDCKDKVTLMSSMLHEIGIESDYVIVNSERGAVNASTPASLAFDHVVIAVHLPAAANDLSVQSLIRHPTLGTLAIFDPTDEFTPFGSLSGPLQGAYGLLVAPAGGELVQLPQLPPANNSLRRTAHARLDEHGTLSGDVDEVFVGTRATGQRALLAGTTGDAHTRTVESRIGNDFTRFEIVRATVAGAHDNMQPLEWHYQLVAEGYAKLNGPLLLVRPRLFGTKSSGVLESPHERLQPFEFNAAEQDHDEFEIELPPGYQVDDLPDPVDLDYGFATYHSKTESIPGKLRYVRSFEVRQLSVPAAQVPKLREMYRAIETDEHVVAVLKRSGP